MFIVFLIAPVISLPIVFYALLKNQNKNNFYIFILAGILAVIGYGFIPNQNSDLFRYFIMLDYMKLNDFGYTIKNSNGLFLQDTIFYLISQTNNYHLLPAISSLFTYWCVFYIISYHARRERMSQKIPIIFMIIFVLALGFQVPFSMIRNGWAFSMFFLAIYMDLVLKKKKLITLPLYILPLFLHHSIFVLILLRIVLPVFKKTNKILSILLLILYPLGIGIFLSFFERIAQLNSYLYAFYYKLNYTSQRLNDEFTIGYSIQNGDIVNTLRKLGTTSILVTILILTLLAINYIYKKNPMSFREYRDYYTFLIILSFFSLSSLSYVIVFDRYAMSILFICSPVFITYWKLIKKDFNNKMKSLYFIFFVSFILIYSFIYTIKRNSNYPEWISSLPYNLFKNIFNLFYF